MWLKKCFKYIYAATQKYFLSRLEDEATQTTPTLDLFVYLFAF